MQRYFPAAAATRDHKYEFFSEISPAEWHIRLTDGKKIRFFSGAEEVQESADRMVSIYRTWIHAKEGYLWGLQFE